MVNTTNNSRPDPEEIKELLREDAPSSLSRDGSRKEDRRNLDFLYDIPLNISVEVGRSKIKLKDLLKMGEGYVLELDKLAGETFGIFT